MIRRLGTIGTCISVVLFPWPLTAFLAVGMSPFEPLVPAAAGLLADTLYYAPAGGSWPHYTFFGVLVSVVAFFVRSRLRTRPVR